MLRTTLRVERSYRGSCDLVLFAPGAAGVDNNLFKIGLGSLPLVQIGSSRSWTRIHLVHCFCLLGLITDLSVP